MKHRYILHGEPKKKPELSLQCNIILEGLRSARTLNESGGLTGMGFMQAGILCYTKRIQELRDKGYDIETRGEPERQIKFKGSELGGM